MVVSHLQASPLEAALDVKAFVGLGTVENRLVAADLVRDEVESLDQAQTQLLALLVLCDGDIFDVTDHSETVNTAVTKNKIKLAIPQCMLLFGPGGGGVWHSQLPLDNEGASAHHTASVFYHQHVVAAILPPNPLEPLCELFFSDVPHSSQDLQTLEEASMVVCLAQRTEYVTVRERSGHSGREQLRAKGICVSVRSAVHVVVGVDSSLVGSRGGGGGIDGLC